MKKSQKIALTYKKMKQDYKQLESLVSGTKPKNLWHHEAAIRKKLRALRQIPADQFSDYNQVYDRFLTLLQDISMRILSDYNRKNNTNYSFEQIVQEDYAAYLNSGILSVLITQHIPKLVADEFTRLFPQNPKDEYPTARKMTRKFILHLGETNTGKTHHAMQRLMASPNGIYLAPLRILALENYERFSQESIPCTLETGEEYLSIEGAMHTCATIEKLHVNTHYSVAVIDEIQFIADTQRGAAWTRAVLGLSADEIHICGAWNAKDQIIDMIQDCGDTYELHEYRRAIPLKVMQEPIPLSRVQAGDALIAFSKRNVLALAQHFSIRNKPCSVIYGDLPPEVRKLQYHTFMSGDRPILVSTDAIGMGVNLPIRRIIFTQLSKFDGEEVRPLTSQEVKQIGGRAGRLGIYDIGYVGSTGNEGPLIDYLLDTPDNPITHAVLGPSELILEIQTLPLIEKLALWSNREDTLPNYRKMDVRDFLLVLEKIRHYRLPETIQWKLMHLPFDVNREELMLLFLTYVELHFVKKNEELPKPFCIQDELAALELSYQKVNLYASFSRTFELIYDEEWVLTARAHISEKIHAFLCRA